MATIKEDYVSFETARLLKEKGFDEGCSFVVNAISKGVMPVSWPTTNSDIEDERANLIALPTLQMAMKWLREVHKLEITPIHDMFQGDSWWYRIERNTSLSLIVEYEEDSIYGSNEQAAEAAIKYCLEHLI